MDYETANGSQFSLRTVQSESDENGDYDEYTSVSAFVDGVAYTGRLDVPPEEADDGDVLNCLEPVPVECIHPLYLDGLTSAPAFDPAVHYLKAPSYTHDDCRPGNNFVADCLLNEATVLEKLRASPHRNILAYHGCVVKNGRITHLCLQRYPSSLVDVLAAGIDEVQYERLREGIDQGVRHLHSLGLAHNDLNEYNVCVDEDGEPVIIDFDSCLPFGKPLLKGVDAGSASQRPVSSKENDLDCLRAVDDFMLCEGMQSR